MSDGQALLLIVGIIATLVLLGSILGPALRESGRFHRRAPGPHRPMFQNRPGARVITKDIDDEAFNI